MLWASTEDQAGAHAFTMQSLINEPQATIQRLFEENGKQADEELLASQFKKLLEGKEDQVSCSARVNRSL